jgi:hypothetical protein
MIKSLNSDVDKLLKSDKDIQLCLEVLSDDDLKLKKRIHAIEDTRRQVCALNESCLQTNENLLDI